MFSELKNLENVSVNFEAEINGQKVIDTFCNNWDNAKNTLIGIREMVKNPIVKLIIVIVISIGDGIQNNVCNKS